MGFISLPIIFVWDPLSHPFWANLYCLPSQQVNPGVCRLSSSGSLHRAWLVRPFLCETS